ncbi:MAG: HAMP domain-containing sensor histidine kinase [Lachnospiraceae bacterium]|jgi:signal transduction histidine kinase|nr:HAMP domain-containing sensor histidine kinase [Lachnospiraceae bacterium]
MKWIIIGLCIVTALQAWMIGTYRRQMKNICRQLSFLMKKDSNMLLTGDVRIGGIGKLLDTLNDYLLVQRKKERYYQEKEKTIANTYTSLSHDIRTPLTSLDGYFQLLETSDTEEEQKKYITIIQDRIKSLKDMLEELFTFTKLKNASFQLELSKCCINQMVKDTIFSYYDEWMEKEIQPHISITDTLLYMQGNKQAIRRVLQNIIKNGLDHGEKEVDISLQEMGQKIVIEIKNKVYHPEDIDITQVFTQFYKADMARSKTSSGLGLSIAKEFVLQMQGEISARIEEEKFCVCIQFDKI